MRMGIAKYANWPMKERLSSGQEPRWLQEHARRSYIVRAVMATPAGVRPRDFKHHLRERDEQSRIHGKPYVLAHIVPLSGKSVCGLNAPWNIKVISARENAAESNHNGWRHGQLFDEPEQFHLFSPRVVTIYE